MRKLFLLTTLWVLSLGIALAQEGRIRVSGSVTDSDNLAIIGAVVVINEMGNIGAVTNASGEYSLSVPRGEYTLQASFLGYKTVEKKIEVAHESIVCDFELPTDAIAVNAVIVTQKRLDDKMTSVQIGAEKIDMELLSKTPTMFGDTDIVKAMTLLPGVKAESDGSSGIQVRGGTSSQNLMLLDDASLYNSGHVMGIFSVFNDDALNNATLYKGLIPSQYGGATSSVFDIHTRMGDRSDYKYSFDIGLLSAKASVEGPIQKDKSSFFLSARRSYFDVFLKATEEYSGNTLNFYDVNAKLSFSFGDKDIVSLSYFTGMDNMGLEDMMKIKWGNKASTLKWTHTYNEDLFAATSLIWSEYISTNDMAMLEMENSYSSFIRNYSLRHEYNWNLGSKHNLRLGLQTTLLDLKSADMQTLDYGISERRKNWENSLWINDEWSLTNRFSVSAGLRLNSYSALGGAPYYQLDDDNNIVNETYYSSSDIVKTYLMFEPRLSMNYRLTPSQSIKGGYSRTTQNIHGLKNGTMSLPFDRYTASSNLIKPEIADQVSLGYVTLTKDQEFEFSVEGYYKSVDNVYDYVNGKSFASEIEIERIILGGQGRSYGAEFLVKKNLGRLTGWLGYTLSWTQNKIEGINNGDWYTASNDRRHDVSLVTMYDIGGNWSASAAFVYNTGQALTAPSAKYDIDGKVVYYYNERNGYRAPDYHRLDFSFSNTKKHKNYTRQWTFGLYNAYSRYNPFIVSFEDDENNPTGTKTIQYSLYGILPSVTYGVKF